MIEITKRNDEVRISHNGHDYLYCDEVHLDFHGEQCFLSTWVDDRSSFLKARNTSQMTVSKGEIIIDIRLSKKDSDGIMILRI